MVENEIKKTGTTTMMKMTMKNQNHHCCLFHHTTTTIILLLLLLFLLVDTTSSQNNNQNQNKNNEATTIEISQWEYERRLEYNKRNYTWPIPNYIPNTLGWKKLMDHRLRQISEIDESQSRYEGYAQTISSAVIQPNFTQYGFGLVRAPESLMIDLRQAISDGLLTNSQRIEDGTHVIEGPNPPWFIDRPDLTKRVLHELQHYVETWVGFEVIPVIAYGFRLYRNESSLHMHVDKSHTHILSFILHIDSSEDAEPWPLTIEDLHGDTHEIVLTSGDLVFYESSKVFHGRPRKFIGSWYTSIFVHYYPKYGWQSVEYYNQEKLYAVPPHWIYPPSPMKFEIPIEMVGTSMKEPSCPNNWCSTQYSYKWSGPGEEGYLITPTQERIPFDPQQTVLACKDHEPDCEEWASLASKECERNPGYMLFHCKKSCGACSSTSSSLNDGDVFQDEL